MPHTNLTDSEHSSPSVPRVGMLAMVRNRRGLVTAVQPFDGSSEGRVNLVTVEYLDPDVPHEDQLIWEREVNASLLEPTALPNVSGDPPMPPADLHSLILATRWSALSPFLDPDGDGSLDANIITAPFHGAVQLEDFQMVPLLKALQMPRIALLLADDVGLGKTIEAGLILTELLLRRRVRKVMVLCPASLRLQWKQELRDKFSLQFDIVDRKSTHALQKRLGLDSNPWRTYSKVITSYDYLKQPDVFEQFRSACRVPKESPHLPWDLLILDEAHNLMPAAYGEESDLTKMLRVIAPLFEHKLFLTATPHNGYTRSFTGLLECLDPVRFTQKGEPLTDSDKRRIEEVVIRRLKSEINARPGTPRFTERYIEALNIRLSVEERALTQAFKGFRERVRELVSAGKRSEQLAGSFAVEILGKRLLSSTVAFADSWHRYCAGLAGDEAATAEEVWAAGRHAKEDLDDDLEIEARGQNAVRMVGSWLRPLAACLRSEIENVGQSLESLGLGAPFPDVGAVQPACDSKFEALMSLVRSILTKESCSGGLAVDVAIPDSAWVDDERLVIFTEYKATLDYLTCRLERICGSDGRVKVLYGGMDDAEREQIKAAFNDPADPVRILVATDAAAEGLNLQETARYVLHYDIPWNPSRLEQRNGRLDRHGQARDVRVYHFTSDDDADMAFLSRVAHKVNTIRDDLGSTGQVFDSAIERRLIQGEDAAVVLTDLDRMIEEVSRHGEVPRDSSADAGTVALSQVSRLADQVDLTPSTLKKVFNDAMVSDGPMDSYIIGPQPDGTYRLRQPVPPRWNPIIDEALRAEVRRGVRGAVPSLAFDPKIFVRDVGGRPVFRPRKDTALLHLGHPVMKQALSTFASRRFPGSDRQVSRWTVVRGRVPGDADALIRVTVEEMATNELRETFHHWVRTLDFIVVEGEIKECRAPNSLGRMDATGPHADDVKEAVYLWDEVSREIRKRLKMHSEVLTKEVTCALASLKEKMQKQEQERFQSRQGEISRLIRSNSIEYLRREIDRERRLRARLLRQPALFGDTEMEVRRLDKSIEAMEEEIRRRQQHAEELQELLRRERDRIIQRIIPKRYALRGTVQVFPVSVEIVLPEK